MTWLYTMNMWMYSFILKFIPAVILTVITGLLIHAIYKADRKSARLKNNASKVKTFSSKNRRWLNGIESMLRLSNMQFLRRIGLFFILLLYLYVSTFRAFTFFQNIQWLSANCLNQAFFWTFTRKLKVKKLKLKLKKLKTQEFFAQDSNSGIFLLSI